MEIFAGMMGVAWLVGIVLIILIPFSVYSAQKWAHKCYEELQKVNRKLDAISAELENKHQS